MVTYTYVRNCFLKLKNHRDINYFKMLTAEQLMKRNVNGKTVFKWVKTYERNEALDCRNYARAAAAMIGLDRFKEIDWFNLSGEKAPQIKINDQPQVKIENAARRQYLKGKENNSSSKSDFWKSSSGRKKSFW